MTFHGRKARILDLDTECRPLSWYAGDFVTKEITAIAWKFVGERGKVQVRALGEVAPKAMLSDFVEAYDQADVVTGHYLRGFDLPLLNGALLELGLAGLKDKLAQDTKLDLDRRGGLSVSQENLGALLGLVHPKVSMNQATWREANRLTPKGIALTKKRVVGDVVQHIELRAALLERDMLSPPKLWTARSSGQGGYHA